VEELAGEAAIHFGEILLLESWRGLDRIALDLSGTTGIDLLGLAALWRVAEATEDLAGVLELQSVPDDIRARLRSHGLDERVVIGPAGEVKALLGAGPDDA
ncbi:MAG TPA: STAS domain-containing protein, partial [Microthrixaceae bacterium]|nr:STAS domain-containing protein [Microthrixaceae bacterium]